MPWDKGPWGVSVGQIRIIGSRENVNKQEKIPIFQALGQTLKPSGMEIMV